MGWRETVSSRPALAIGAACIALSGVAAMGLEAPVRLEVGDVAGLPTSRQVLAVTLRSNVEVGGVQSDLVVPPQATLSVRPNALPFCTIGPDLPVRHSSASFRFAPDGCTPGVDCGVRAVVMRDDGAIPDGTVLYTCEIAIAPQTTPGAYAIDIANLGASDPQGGALDAVGDAGTLTVHEGVAARLRVGEVVGMPGMRATVDVFLHTDVVLSGVQGDLIFAPWTRIPARSNGRPDCANAVMIGHASPSFAFLPQGCTPGVDCSGVRALILTYAAEGIPSGSLLYRCAIDIAADAPLGRYVLDIANAGASDPYGQPVPTGGVDGLVLVFDRFQARLEVRSVRGAPGEMVAVEVTLRSDAEIAGTINELAFDATTPIAVRRPGKPACREGPEITRGTSAFAFRPPGCTAGVDCTGVLALVLALDNVDPIPDRGLLYTCDVVIAADAAPGAYPLVISNVGASNPQGESVPAEGRDGVVLVELATPTATLTPTLTPIPPTHFRTATSTTTPSQTLAPTATARRNGGGDGCAVIAPSAGGDWWLLLPLLVLARRRGRSDLKAVAPGCR